MAATMEAMRTSTTHHVEEQGSQAARAPEALKSCRGSSALGEPSVNKEDAKRALPASRAQRFKASARPEGCWFR